jgi:hypothetical protein
MIRKISWLVTLGALVAAVVAVPALGATESQTSKLVQIGGRLVPPSQLSAFESHAGQPVSRSSHLVQIGGRLVPPSQVSSTERQLSSAWLAANGSSGSSSHVGRDLGIGLGTAALLAAALLMVAAATRRRHRLTTA